MKHRTRIKLTSRTAQIAVGLIVLSLVAYFVYASFTLSVSSPATVNGATSATLNSATIRFPNGTAGPTCTVSGNSASCPQVFLRLGGGGGEAGNYSIDVTFTVIPVGDVVTLNCQTSTPLVCIFPSSNTSTTTIISTGSSQTISPIVKPTGLGSAITTVTLAG